MFPLSINMDLNFDKWVTKLGTVNLKLFFYHVFLLNRVLFLIKIITIEILYF